MRSLFLPKLVVDEYCGEQYWDPAIRNSTIVPLVTQCFQHTTLVWIPTAIVFLLAPILMAQIFYRRPNPIPWTKRIRLKIGIACILIADSLSLFTIAIYKTMIQGLPYAVDFLYPLTLCLAMVVLTALIVSCRNYGIVTSGELSISWLVFTLSAIPELVYWIQQIVAPEEAWNWLDYPRCTAFFIWIGCCTLQTYLHCYADTSTRGYKYLSSTRKPSPKCSSSFLKRITMWWFNALCILGFKKPLEVTNLYSLNEADTSNSLVPKWFNLWEKQSKKFEENRNCRRADSHLSQGRRLTSSNDSTPLLHDQTNDNYGSVPTNRSIQKLPSIIWTLFLMFKLDCITVTLIKFLSDILLFCNPMLLKSLIRFNEQLEKPMWQGVALALTMFLSTELSSILLSHYFYLMYRVGTRVLTFLTAAVYRKTLRLSNSARREKTVREIVNLMAIDIDRFQQITTQTMQYWSNPFQIGLALFLLYQQLGVSVFSGVGVMVLLFPVNFVITMIIRKWQIAQMYYKDERTKMVNEVLNGIKIIKLYAWEPPMEKVIEDLREKELQLIKKTAFLRTFSDMLNCASPFLVALSTFVTFIFIDPKNILTPEIAFVSLTLFNQLRSPMSRVAELITQTVQVVVSNRRLKEFLMSEELNNNAIDHQARDNSDVINVNDATFSWESAEHNAVPTLSNISFKVNGGQLVTIVGRVGAGKSSVSGGGKPLRGRGKSAKTPKPPKAEKSKKEIENPDSKAMDSKVQDDLEALEQIKQSCTARPTLLPDPTLPATAKDFNVFWSTRTWPVGLGINSCKIMQKTKPNLNITYFFEERGWMCSETMSHWLVRRIPMNPKKSFVDGLFWQSPSFERVINRLLISFESVIVPVVQLGHWTVFEVSKQASKWYDPYHQAPSKEMKKVMKRLPGPIIQLKGSRVPMQTDGFTCGVHSAIMGMHMINNKSWDVSTSENDVKTFKQKFAEELCQEWNLQPQPPEPKSSQKARLNTSDNQPTIRKSPRLHPSAASGRVECVDLNNSARPLEPIPVSSPEAHKSPLPIPPSVTVVVRVGQRIDFNMFTQKGAPSAEGNVDGACLSRPDGEPNKKRKSKVQPTLTCLTAEKLCDGTQHCPDGSDESICSSTCSTDQFKCPGNNACLPFSAKCNGINECSDEPGIDLTSLSLKPHSHVSKESQTPTVDKLSDEIVDVLTAHESFTPLQKESMETVKIIKRDILEKVIPAAKRSKSSMTYVILGAGAKIDTVVHAQRVKDLLLHMGCPPLKLSDIEPMKSIGSHLHNNTKGISYVRFNISDSLLQNDLSHWISTHLPIEKKKGEHVQCVKYTGKRNFAIQTYMFHLFQCMTTDEKLAVVPSDESGDVTAEHLKKIIMHVTKDTAMKAYQILSHPARNAVRNMAQSSGINDDFWAKQDGNAVLPPLHKSLPHTAPRLLDNHNSDSMASCADLYRVPELSGLYSAPKRF